YEKYREAKGLMFKGLSKSGKTGKKIIVVNRMDDEADYFLKFKADEKWAVCDDCEKCKISDKEKSLCADSFNLTPEAIGFTVQGQLIHLPLPGQFMMSNALLAIATALSLDISLTTCKEALEKINLIPGRLEFVEAGQDFKVIVDYAHEPRSFAAILQTGHELAQDHKLIAVFGVTGGGRDKAKRPKMGEIASQYADYIILTTDDPYDDDPKQLVSDITPGIKGSKWVENQNWWQVLDRRQAINQALAMARSGDVILLLGKGSEQVMAVAGGKTIPWNDAQVARELLKK
ncbi:MAG: cyanophycin synthetase, partial [Patescibacteria group bacterium]